MMYKVIHHFTDLQDNNYKYTEGDNYPRQGYEPSEERIAELATDENRLKKPLIAAVDETPEVVETSTASEEKPKRRRKKTEE